MAPEGQSAPWEAEIDFAVCARLIWNYRWIMVLMAATAAVTSLLISGWLLPREYESTSIIQVRQGPDSLGAPEVYRRLLLNRGTLSRVAKATGLTVGELGRNLSVQTSPGSELFVLKARGSSSAMATEVGRAWYREFQSSVIDAWRARVSVELRLASAGLAGIARSASGPAGRDSAGESEVMRTESAASFSGEIGRLRAVLDSLAHRRLPELYVLEGFGAGQQISSKVPRTVASAVFATLVVAAVGIVIWQRGGRVT